MGRRLLVVTRREGSGKGEGVGKGGSEKDESECKRGGGATNLWCRTPSANRGRPTGGSVGPTGRVGTFPLAPLAMRPGLLKKTWDPALREVLNPATGLRKRRESSSSTSFSFWEEHAGDRDKGEKKKEKRKRS